MTIWQILVLILATPFLLAVAALLLTGLCFVLCMMVIYPWSLILSIVPGPVGRKAQELCKELTDAFNL